MGNHKGTIQKKLATYDTRDEGKQNINTAEYVLDTTMRNQTSTT